MKTLKNQIDVLRLDYIGECADLLAARAVALRFAAVAGDVDGIDAAFSCIRLIGRDISITRKEIETRSDTKKSEAA